jgi:hypothetical protein
MKIHKYVADHKARIQKQAGKEEDLVAPERSQISYSYRRGKSCSPYSLFQCVQIAYNIPRLRLRNTHVWHRSVLIHLLRGLSPSHHVFGRVW